MYGYNKFNLKEQPSRADVVEFGNRVKTIKKELLECMKFVDKYFYRNSRYYKRFWSTYEKVTNRACNLDDDPLTAMFSGIKKDKRIDVTMDLDLNHIFYGDIVGQNYLDYKYK